MKKSFIMLLALLFALTACGAEELTENTQNGEPEHTADETENTEAPSVNDYEFVKMPSSPSYIDEVADKSTYGGRIILENGNLEITGMGAYVNNFSVKYPNRDLVEICEGVNCFLVFDENLFIFRDGEVLRVPGYGEPSEERGDVEYGTIINDNGETDFGVVKITPEDYTPTMNALNSINSKSEIIRAEVGALGDGDVFSRNDIYVFTKEGNCYRVSYSGETEYLENVCDIICNSDLNTVLYKDGTCACLSSHPEFAEELNRELSEWKNIRYISADRENGGPQTVFGIKDDGTVLLAGDYRHNKAEVEAWTDVAYAVIIDVWTDEFPVAFTSGGEILVPSDCGWKWASAVTEIKDAVEIGLSDGKLFIRKQDGTVLVPDITGIPASETEEYEPESEAPGFASVKVGDVVKLGRYEQNNNTSDGAEDIEWIVLEVNDNSALLLSRYGIDTVPFDNGGNRDGLWETSSVRQWLNSEFAETVFSEDELKIIETGAVETATEPITDPDKILAVKETADKLFLLSYDEANSLLKSDEERRCLPTVYAAVRGAWENPYSNDEGYEEYCRWWLRSPSGFDEGGGRYVYFVFASGATGLFCGESPVALNIAVRPAMRVSITRYDG